MKGFGIYVKNDLLEPKHIEAMGVSVWLYFWFLDKMTSISEEGVGLVLGGKPIKFEEINRELGLAESTYSRYCSVLKKGGYINVTRTPHGLRVSVNKAVKIFNNKNKSHPSKVKDESVPSLSGSDTSKMGERFPKMTDVNKDSTEDNTKTLQKETAPLPSKFFEDARAKTEPYRQKILELAKADELFSAKKLHQLMLEEFIPHWEEGAETGKKMRWQRERVFDPWRRFATWVRNSHNFAKDWRCKWNHWHRRDDRCYHAPKEEVAPDAPVREMPSEMREGIAALARGMKA